MLPVVTPAEMAAIDAAAPEPTAELIHRAGGAVARHAIDMLGGTYGRRIVVVAGPGNNGRDGVDAAERLRARGAVVRVTSPAAPWPAGNCDLAIDAAYGTGLRDRYDSPIPEGVRVLAVDIPSGLDGVTGIAHGAPTRAERTVTFAALKPGLLLGEGPELCGEVVLADIGLPTSSARIGLVEDGDLRAWISPRPRDAHKWNRAVRVIGGSPGMTGAPSLAAGAAFAAGAGYVNLSVPGVEVPSGLPLEVVTSALPGSEWADAVLAELGRFSALVVGPGLGRDDHAVGPVAALVASAPVPMVIDGDGLWAISRSGPTVAVAPRVLTPHDGEFERLSGAVPGADRIASVRSLAASYGSTVLLKGATTVVASPEGRVLLVNSGDARLATAGTGDVLSGIIGALLAAGVGPLEAAAAGAHLHGLAAQRCDTVGMVASDLIAPISSVLSELLGATASRSAGER